MGGGNGLSTGGSAVFVKPVIFNTFIEAVPTREVVTVKTVLGKNPAGDITAQTRLAHDVDRLCAVQFRHPGSRRSSTGICFSKPLAYPFSCSASGPCVQKCNAAILGQSSKVFIMKLFYHAAQQVLSRKPRHVHRIFCRRIRRRIGQVQIFQRRHRHARLHCDSDHIRPLIDARQSL